MKSFQGHRSWNAWNVSLWICNDEPLYRFAMDCINSRDTLNKAVARFMRVYGGDKTPDGAVYNRISVKKALEGLME